MKSEQEIRNAFIHLMNERGSIETEMTNQEKYRNNLLRYNNLLAQHNAFSTEIRMLQWVLSEPE